MLFRSNNDKTYEAYNRLIRKDAKPDPEIDPPSEALLDLLASRVTAGDTWFRVKFDAQLVSALESKLAPMLSSRHSLPENWKFNAFALAQYRRVMLALQAMMYGWHLTRQLVAQERMPGMGYPSAVWLVPTKELGARLRRFTGLPKSAINSILDLITFGSNDIREPDIARQPLVDLKNGYFALAPFVFLNLNVEGNLCALLNQISTERDRYLALVDDKEDALVGEIKSDLNSLGFDFERGEVDGTDIDLAIIDRTNRACLCLELKWFIEPAEIREVEDRTKDLAKGVKQAKQVAALFERGDKELLRLLRIDPEYTFLSAVGSVNWIGFGDVQDPAVPIIKVRHLVSTLQSSGSLKDAISWLNDRAYLPSPGDYEVKPWEIACGGWKATWYGIFVP